MSLIFVDFFFLLFRLVFQSESIQSSIQRNTLVLDETDWTVETRGGNSVRRSQSRLQT